MTEGVLEDYYARRAAEYDRVYGKPERQADLSELKSVLSNLFRGLDVLEIACGTGYWTQYIAHSAKSLTATDLNEETLEVARRRKYGDCHVRFLREDAYQLKASMDDYHPVTSMDDYHPVISIDDYHDEAVEGHFNGGFAGFWWSHVPRHRYSEMLRSVHSRLSNGALMVWLDNRFIEGSSTPLSRKDADGNTYQIRHLESGEQYEVLKNFPSQDELLTQFSPWSEQVEVRLFQYYWLLRYNVK